MTHLAQGRSVTLNATTLTEARRERESLLSGFREGRIAKRDDSTFASLFSEWQQARSLSERTRAHEQHLLDRHLATLTGRRVQDVDARDLAKILRRMRDLYSPWTATAVYRLLVGVFAFSVRRGIIVRSPVDGLVATEKPRQKNQKQIALLDAQKMNTLVTAGGSERWQAALGLAGYAALRLGEVRALRWRDVSFDESTINVSRSLLPDGQAKPTKTDAGTRTVALFPELRRALLRWRIKSPHTAPDDYIVCTATGAAVMERNLSRALGAAKTAAGDRRRREAPELACTSPQRREHLADRIRARGHHRQRDDGPQQSKLHVGLLRA